MYNTFTMKKGFDLGILSFAGSASSSIYVHQITKNGLEDFIPCSVVGRMAILVTHIFVAANYALGLIFALTVGSTVYVRFATYCAIFTLIWIAVAVQGWNFITKTMDIGVEEDDEDESDNIYGFNNTKSRRYENLDNDNSFNMYVRDGEESRGYPYVS